MKFSKSPWATTGATWKVSNREQEEQEGQLTRETGHEPRVPQLLAVPLLTRVQSHRV